MGSKESGVGQLRVNRGSWESRERVSRESGESKSASKGDPERVRRRSVESQESPKESLKGV